MNKTASEIADDVLVKISKPSAASVTQAAKKGRSKLVEYGLLGAGTGAAAYAIGKKREKSNEKEASLADSVLAKLSEASDIPIGAHLGILAGGAAGALGARSAVDKASIPDIDKIKSRNEAWREPKMKHLQNELADAQNRKHQLQFKSKHRGFAPSGGYIGEGPLNAEIGDIQQRVSKLKSQMRVPSRSEWFVTKGMKDGLLKNRMAKMILGGMGGGALLGAGAAALRKSEPETE